MGIFSRFLERISKNKTETAELPPIPEVKPLVVLAEPIEEKKSEVVVESIYDEDGYDASGYDKDGYNREGYDHSGYDRDGFSRRGLNRKGYDRNGFNQMRYNKEGINILGFNRDGFDAKKYSYLGFDEQKFNSFGYDKDGFNRNGINQFGHTKEDYLPGTDFTYLKETGLDDQGYGRDGYNLDGYNREGYRRSGYNDEGYDCNGYDVDGYDKDGYDKDGYDRKGFDRRGYDRLGYDDHGFNKSGYDRNNFDLSGYDPDGFDVDGYNIFGFDRYNRTEEDNKLLKNQEMQVSALQPGDVVYSTVYGKMEVMHRQDRMTYFWSNNLSAKPHLSLTSLQRHLDLNPPKRMYSNVYGEIKVFPLDHTNFVLGHGFLREIKRYGDGAFQTTLFFSVPDSWLQAEESFEQETFDKEYSFLKEVSKYIDEIYLKKLKANINKHFKSAYEEENPMHFNTYANNHLHALTAQSQYERVRSEIKREPYFASIELNGKRLYIGKNEIVAKDKGIEIIHWKDKRSQVYYQYQDMMTNADLGLSLVRDYTLVFDRLFMYFDQYNKNSNMSTKDERMTKLLMAHRSSKHVTDIVKSIQKKQYEIISQDLSKELLVQGCAGSGKTMILFHRLSYLLFNDPELKIQDVFLISPTNLLAMQTDQLSKNLKLDDAYRATHKQFMLDIYKYYVKKLDAYDPIKEVSENKIKEFSEEKIKSNYQVISSKIHDESYLKEEQEKLDGQWMKMIDDLSVGLIKKTDDSISYDDRYTLLIELKNKILRKCKNYSSRNYDAIMDAIDARIDDLTDFAEIYRKVDLFVKHDAFFGVLSKEQNTVIKAIQKENDEEELLELMGNIASPLTQLLKKQDKEKLLKQEFKSPKEFVISLIRNSEYLQKCELSEVKDIVDQFIVLPLELANAILDKCKEKLSEIKDLELYRKILAYLKDNGFAGNQDYYESEELFGEKRNSYKRFEDVYKFFLAFRWDDHVDDNFMIRENIKDPFDYFNVLEFMDDKRNRFIAFKEGKTYKYLFDIIFEALEPGVNVLEEPSKIMYDQLLTYVYSYVQLEGAVDQDKHLIFVDEFQDLSLFEILLMRQVFSSSIFNYYGDTQQSIEEHGIKDVSTLSGFIDDLHIFELMVNYRNAKQITEYVNEHVSLDGAMMPTGVMGIAQEIPETILSIKEYLNYEKNDRVAFIVKDKSQLIDKFENALNLIDIRLNKTNVIPRGRPIIYSVEDVKGLEFDIVFVDDMDMDEHEKYIAFTRALNNLYVLRQVS